MNKGITSNIFCSAYGHNYTRLSQANPDAPELVCKCCKGYFKFENNGAITAVSQEENEELFSPLYRKRIA